MQQWNQTITNRISDRRVFPLAGNIFLPIHNIGLDNGQCVGREGGGLQTTIDSPLRSLSVARNEFTFKTSLYVEKCVSMIGNINREHRLEESWAWVGRCLESVFSKTRPWLSYPAGRTNILWTTFTGRNRTSGAAGGRQGGGEEEEGELACWWCW